MELDEYNARVQREREEEQRARDDSRLRLMEQLQAAEVRALHAEVRDRFRKSLAGTHPELYYEVDDVRDVAKIPAIEDAYTAFVDALPDDCTEPERMKRDVFHTCPEQILPLILAGGMRPSQCVMCRGQAQLIEHDYGFFGDRSKGVYVSKHADYTFFYQNSRKPRVGDEGAVMMLEMVTGKTKYFNERRDGAPPTPNFHCHESPNHLEFFVWDDETQAEPPRSTYRAVPRFVIHWRAVQSRGGIEHDM
jgi:hypothetical protein